MMKRLRQKGKRSAMAKHPVLVLGCSMFFLLSLLFATVNAKATSNQMMNVNQLIAQGEQANNHYTQATKHKIHTADGAILFVSLGMPKLVLRQYLRQANKLHIPIVIRGFLHNNMKLTAHRVYGLLHPKNQQPIKSGFEIDPVLFRAFHVSVVPALVMTTNNGHCEERENCASSQYSIVYGNVPLASLLSLIAKHADNGAIRRMAMTALSGNREDDRNG
jgi:type-F conjugative transfer system pilin assembly protein TrbC